MITTTILAIVESFWRHWHMQFFSMYRSNIIQHVELPVWQGGFCYLAMCQVTTVALASFVGTLAVVLISRIFTVRKKCPITIFLFPGIIPLVPGAGIYYTAYYLVTGQMSLAAVKGLEAVKIAFAIVLGIIFVVSIPRDAFQIRYWRAKRKRKRLKNHGNM